MYARPLQDAIDNKNLWFVRSTQIYNPLTKDYLANYSREQYYNYADLFDYKKIFDIPEKAGFNQSINFLVIPFTIANNWECRKYIFVAPVSEFQGELWTGNLRDFLTIGPHTYTEESYLLVPQNELEQVKKDFPKLRSQIKGYNYPPQLEGLETEKCFERVSRGLGDYTTPRQAVNNLLDEIQREKGYEIWRLDPNVEAASVTSPPNDAVGKFKLLKPDRSDADVDGLLKLLNKESTQVSAPDGSHLEQLTKKLHIAINKIKTNPVNNSDVSTPAKPTPPAEPAPPAKYSREQAYSSFGTAKPAPPPPPAFISDIEVFPTTKEECDKVFAARSVDIYYYCKTLNHEISLISVNNNVKKILLSIYDKSINMILYLEILHTFKKLYRHLVKELIDEFKHTYTNPSKNVVTVSLVNVVVNESNAGIIRKIRGVYNLLSNFCINNMADPNALPPNLIDRGTTTLQEIKASFETLSRKFANNYFNNKEDRNITIQTQIKKKEKRNITIQRQRNKQTLEQKTLKNRRNKFRELPGSNVFVGGTRKNLRRTKSQKRR